MFQKTLGYNIIPDFVNLVSPLFTPKPPQLLKTPGLDLEARRYNEALQKKSIANNERAVNRRLAREASPFLAYAGAVGMSPVIVNAVLSRITQEAAETIKQFESEVEDNMFFEKINMLQNMQYRWNQYQLNQYDLKRMRQQRIQEAVCGGLRLGVGLGLFSRL